MWLRKLIEGSIKIPKCARKLICQARYFYPMDMMLKKTGPLLLLIFTATVLCGCDDVDKVRQDFNSQMAEMKKTILSSTKDFTAAIPGGTYWGCPIG